MDQATHDTRWTRWFEDATVVSSATSAGGTTPAPVTPAVVAAWTRCGINQPSVDLLTPDDDRLAALVWSFEPGAPEPPLGSCARLSGEGRLHATGCDDAHHPWTCVGPAGVAVTPTRGPWHGGDEAWVSLRHVGGTWRLGCAPGRDAGPLWLDTRPPVSCPAG